MLKHYIGYADYYTRVRFEFDSEPEEAQEKARDLAFTSGMDEATTKLEVERVRCEPCQNGIEGENNHNNTKQGKENE